MSSQERILVCFGNCRRLETDPNERIQVIGVNLHNSAHAHVSWPEFADSPSRNIAPSAP